MRSAVRRTAAIAALAAQPGSTTATEFAGPPQLVKLVLEHDRTVTY